MWRKAILRTPQNAEIGEMAVSLAELFIFKWSLNCPLIALYGCDAWDRVQA